MAARDTWQRTAMGLKGSCSTVDNQVSCVLHSASPGVPSEKTQRLKLATPDPSAPGLSLCCLGEGSHVDPQAAHTDQMEHVTSLRVNGGLPERLVLPRQSHSMAQMAGFPTDPCKLSRWIRPLLLPSHPQASLDLCRRKCRSGSWVLLLQ